VRGDGFGVPLVLRYLLETCADVPGAIAALERIPVHMAYNISLLDSAGRYAVVAVAPDRPAAARRDQVATNHQDNASWAPYSKIAATHERERVLRRRLAEPGMDLERFAQGFLRGPLFSAAYARGWGTLYTALCVPAGREVTYLWPGRAWRQSLEEFVEGSVTTRYAAEEGLERTARLGPPASS
jgi:predicted choloylglycine hydrolase